MRGIEEVESEEPGIGVGDPELDRGRPGEHTFAERLQIWPARDLDETLSGNVTEQEPWECGECLVRTCPPRRCGRRCSIVAYSGWTCGYPCFLAKNHEDDHRCAYHYFHGDTDSSDGDGSDARVETYPAVPAGGIEHMGVGDEQGEIDEATAG